jgi:hypothetical protein
MLTNFGLAETNKLTLSYSMKDGTGISASPPVIKASANRYISSMDPFPSTMLSGLTQPT